MSACDENGNPTDPDHPWNAPTQKIADLRGTIYDSRLAGLEAAYADGNVGALFEALALCDKENLPLPSWALRASRMAVLESMVGGVKQGEGRHARWLNRYRDDLRDLERYEAVLAGREQAIKWTDVYAWAAKQVTGTENSEHAVRAAYRRVQKRMKEEPARYRVFQHFRPMG